MNGSTALRKLYRSSRRSIQQYHAPFRLDQTTQRANYVRPAANHVFRNHLLPSTIVNQIRRQSSNTGEKPLTDRSPAASTPGASPCAEEIAARKAQEPAYELTFTCRKCMERSSHRVTKQAYHFGTTLITCPGCKNRHLISDHLKIFSDKGITIEDILREKGQFLKKGRLGEDGDIEFYDESSNEIGLAQKYDDGKD